MLLFSDKEFLISSRQSNQGGHSELWQKLNFINIEGNPITCTNLRDLLSLSVTIQFVEIEFINCWYSTTISTVLTNSSVIP